MMHHRHPKLNSNCYFHDTHYIDEKKAENSNTTVSCQKPRTEGINCLSEWIGIHDVNPPPSFIKHKHSMVEEEHDKKRQVEFAAPAQTTNLLSSSYLIHSSTHRQHKNQDQCVQSGDNHTNSVGDSPHMYSFGKIMGAGSFGVVSQAVHRKTGEKVAIKTVLQDQRYKNRELSIMKELSHPNIIQLLDYFYTEHAFVIEDSSSEADVSNPERYLNVVMEHIPDTVCHVLKSFVRSGRRLPMVLVRLYIYQLCRSVGYLHSLGICHRDIKPQNLLINTKTHVLKLCDFGSAKRLVKSEQSVAYICSRFYRAPELMLGATEYTTAIDIWSVGCVLGELLMGYPLFCGDTSVDQLVKIIQVLGTPSQKQMQAMNPNYQEFRFPDVHSRPWKQVFNNAFGEGSEIPTEAFQLLDAFLKYEPKRRLKAYDALAHPFFNPLREMNCYVCDDVPLPDLFNFYDYELQSMSSESASIVVPEWYKKKKKNEMDAVSSASSLLDGCNNKNTKPNSSDSLCSTLHKQHIP